jgi:hypothetical protein
VNVLLDSCCFDVKNMILFLGFGFGMRITTVLVFCEDFGCSQTIALLLNLSVLAFGVGFTTVKRLFGCFFPDIWINGGFLGRNGYEH